MIGYCDRMESIPAGEFNRRSGELFARTFRGESILITHYGRPYVLLSPPPAPADSEVHPNE
jgi:antitoxin (DNA-binding transcriptional repressor) of toxin-antitoxin stability system